MKRLNRFLVCIVCSLVLCISFINIYAKCNDNYVTSVNDISKCDNLLFNKNYIADVSSKVETVYGMLDKSGKVNKICIVNEFDVLNNGIIYDYGSYSNVKPLSPNVYVDIEHNVNKIIATKGKLYYQGDLVKTNLPWNIDIKYYLDNKEICPDNLGGKTGKLKIRTNVTKNKNIDLTFYNNYLVQITFSLNTNYCTNIVANTSTIANAGKVKKVNFTSMPGKDSTFELMTDINNFEMTGVSFSGIPLNMNIDLPDINIVKDKFSVLSTSIAQLNDGASNLKIGSNRLNDTINTISKGSNDINDGIKSLSLGMLDVKKGSSQIYEALKQFEYGINNFNNEFNTDVFLEMSKGLKNIVTSLEQIKDKLNLLQENYEKVYIALNNAIDKIPKESITENQINTLIGENKNNKQFKLLLNYYAAGLEVKNVYNYVKPGLQSVKDNLPILTKAIGDISVGMKDSLNKLSNITLDNDSNKINMLYENIHKLVVQYDMFNNSIILFSGYIDNANVSYEKYDMGVSKLSENYNTFDNNIEKFSLGLNELNNNTKDLPEQIENEFKSIVDNFDSGDFKPISFVSRKNNKNIMFVQFLFKTKSIKNNVVLEKETINIEGNTLLDRIINLFK